MFFRNLDCDIRASLGRSVGAVYVDKEMHRINAMNKGPDLSSLVTSKIAPLHQTNHYRAATAPSERGSVAPAMTPLGCRTSAPAWPTMSE